MSERPILFSGRMIRALLDGSKTQTRRVVKPQPEPIPADVWKDRRVADARQYWWPCNPARSMVEIRDMSALCPYGMRGDRLWVRETWAHCVNRELGDTGEYFTQSMPVGSGTHVVYRADEEAGDDAITWRPSIFMPRWASRLTLTISDVRVERLHDISEADAIAEGCVAGHPMTELDLELMRGTEVYELAKELGIGSYPSAKFNYSMLWDSINAKHARWPSNPWVWVLTFEVERST